MTREQLAYGLSFHLPVISAPDELPLVPDVLDTWSRRVEAAADDEPKHEFCASVRLDTEMVAATCAAGFIPMGLAIWGEEVLLIKSHAHRCVLGPGALHVADSTRRRARGLELRIDHDFEGCLADVVAQWPERWLTEKLCAALTRLHEEARHGVRTHCVSVHSDGQRVAGEIGYSCGSVYTSMSGFHSVSGTGSVQMAALGALLARRGAAFWDLGMDAEYKRALGARLVDRRTFLARYATAAGRPPVARRQGTEPLLVPTACQCDALLADALH